MLLIAIAIKVITQYIQVMRKSRMHRRNNDLLSFILKVFFEIMEGQNQPSNIKFPKRTFGVKNPEQRSFNPEWYKPHPWLHYDEVSSLIIKFIIIYIQSNVHNRT